LVSLALLNASFAGLLDLIPLLVAIFPEITFKTLPNSIMARFLANERWTAA
jgi:hypothetical protein